VVGPDVFAATPVWVTVTLATATGIFGLLSGAAAAAAVTTSHETREVFRDRMIEAADAFIAQEIKVDEALARLVKTSKLGPELVGLEFSDEIHKAAELAQELSELVPRLWIVFRRAAPGATAQELVSAHSATASGLFDGYDVAHERLRDARVIRQRLLEAFNREIRRRWRL
jgi:hypothetical protein